MEKLVVGQKKMVMEQGRRRWGEKTVNAKPQGTHHSGFVEIFKELLISLGGKAVELHDHLHNPSHLRSSTSSSLHS